MSSLFVCIRSKEFPSSCVELRSCPTYSLTSTRPSSDLQYYCIHTIGHRFRYHASTICPRSSSAFIPRSNNSSLQAIVFKASARSSASARPHSASCAASRIRLVLVPRCNTDPDLSGPRCTGNMYLQGSKTERCRLRMGTSSANPAR